MDGQTLVTEAAATPLRFETKVAIVLDDSLAVWQKANVTAFLVSGLVADDPSLVGEPYADGSGNRYVPMCRQPIFVYAADAAGLRRAYERALARDVGRFAIFTHDLFATGARCGQSRGRRRRPGRRARARGHRPACREPRRRQGGRPPSPARLSRRAGHRRHSSSRIAK